MSYPTVSDKTDIDQLGNLVCGDLP